MPVSPPTGRRPWPSDTIALPNRIRAQIVLCQEKLPTTPKFPPHHWMVVLEAGGDTFTVVHVMCHLNGGVQWRLGGAAVFDSYPEARMRWRERADQMAGTA